MATEPVDEKLLEKLIDETLADSFPASDPPSWTLGRERQKNPNDSDSSAQSEQPSDDGPKKTTLPAAHRNDCGA